MKKVRELLQEYKDYMTLKNFSQKTIKTYYQIAEYFHKYCEVNFPQVLLSDDLVRKYLLHRFDKKLSWQTVNSDYSSLQKYFKNVLMLPWSLKKLPRPRKEKTLPTIFSKEEVKKLIEATRYYNQQVMLTFIYVTGCRLSETISVKIEDIDSNRNQIRINKGKGNKDRFILIPAEFIKLLREYYIRVRPEKFLFNGLHKGSQYSVRSLQRILQIAKKNAKIFKKGSIHTLRNCYATHHLENGTDLVFLQEQMGHKNIKTTIRYINLCVERHRYIKHPILDMNIRYQTKEVSANYSAPMEKNISKYSILL
jgi:integrase/recombinase XerD